MNASAAAIDPAPQADTKSKTKVWRSKDQRKVLLEALTSSGLTKTAFCQKHSIAPSNLYR